MKCPKLKLDIAIGVGLDGFHKRFLILLDPLAKDIDVRHYFKFPFGG